jgi:hypothetical protein
MIMLKQRFVYVVLHIGYLLSFFALGLFFLDELYELNDESLLNTILASVSLSLLVALLIQRFFVKDLKSYALNRRTTNRTPFDQVFNRRMILLFILTVSFTIFLIVFYPGNLALTMSFVSLSIFLILNYYYDEFLTRYYYKPPQRRTSYKGLMDEE